jgi:hypothetical protein
LGAWGQACVIVVLAQNDKTCPRFLQNDNNAGLTPVFRFLLLVTDHAENPFAFFHVCVCFNAFGGKSV